MPQDTPAFPPSHASTSLVLEGAGVSIEGKEVLRDLTLDVQITRIGIVGRNGSGKSTLSRLITGLISPSQGKVQVNGGDLFKDRKQALRDVGLLFQNPDHQIIFPTVIEEVSFGLTQTGLTRAEADTAARATLQAFGKTHWAEAHVNALSQGQKHLLCLISITAMQPQMIVLDEPFAGLDIPTKAQLHRYLALYPGNVIHVSHDPEDLRDCDDILWIDEGRIKAHGPTAAVLPRYVDAMIALGEADDIADLPG